MRKNIWYVVALLAVLLGIYAVYFRNPSESVFGNKEDQFSYTDTASIYSIFLADRKGNKIHLQRAGNIWTVNEKYQAMAPNVNDILRVIATQKAMYPIPKIKHNDIVKGLAGSGIKVELYNEHGEQLRVFYMGGVADDNQGSYMLLEGAQHVYVVNMLGFNGYLTPYYSTMIEDWRSRIVFDALPHQIKSVIVLDASDSLASFKLEQTKDSFLLKPLAKKFVATTPMIQGKAKSYLDFFKFVNCEGYLNGLPKLDSLISSAPPKGDIYLELNDNTRQHVRLFWMYMNKRSKNVYKENGKDPLPYDGDRCYAVFNKDADTAIIQLGIFNKITRKAIEFYHR
jgi:hypothetical protein